MSAPTRSADHPRRKDRSNEPLILVAEDNPGDVFLLKHVISVVGVECQLAVARNGDEVIRYIERCGDPPLNHSPTHLLLDLKMPLRDGFEVLAWLRSNAAWAKLPVIVLTSSALDVDKRRAQEYGIDAYFVKARTLDEFADVVRNIFTLWGLL